LIDAIEAVRRGSPDLGHMCRLKVPRRYMRKNSPKCAKAMRESFSACAHSEAIAGPQFADVEGFSP